MKASLTLVQLLVAIVSMVASTLYLSAGDYVKATYYLGWAILMTIFLHIQAPREEK